MKMTDEEKWSLPVVLDGIEQFAIRIASNPIAHPFDKDNALGIVDIVREFRERREATPTPPGAAVPEGFAHD